MGQIAILAGALLALAFGLANGVLMCISPVRHASFWRWYTRSGAGAQRPLPGAQTQMRAAGLVLTFICVFFGWMLVGKFLGR